MAPPAPRLRGGQAHRYHPGMRCHRDSFEVATGGRGLYEISREVAAAVRRAGVSEGLVNVFVHHTSASLVITENADPSVQRDLNAFFARLVPDGDALYQHVEEGDDDMSAHVRSVLTQTFLSIPIAGGRPDLGTWQGIFLWEHRVKPHRRRLTVTILH